MVSHNNRTKAYPCDINQNVPMSHHYKNPAVQCSVLQYSNN